MSNGYMTSATRILERGRNANSYKFALLRSLVAFGNEPGEGAAVLTHGWLAQRFLELYWPLTIKFRIRQATDPNRDPVVMRLIREEEQRDGLALGGELKTFSRRFPKRYERLVGQMAGEAFGDVIPRFHMVDRSAVTPAFYSATEDGIRVGSKSRRFLCQNAGALDLMAVAAWVRFTEKYTSAPRLFEKIRGQKPRRASLLPYREFLERDERGICFYCAKAEPNLVVDHVIPWTFVAEDKVWNLVLACADCNSAKSNRTPTGASIARLLKANEELLRSDPDSLPQRVRRDLKEWRVGGLNAHVLGLVNRCHADGFQSWEP